MILCFGCDFTDIELYNTQNILFASKHTPISGSNISFISQDPSEQVSANESCWFICKHGEL